MENLTYLKSVEAKSYHSIVLNDVDLWETILETGNGDIDLSFKRILKLIEAEQKSCAMDSDDKLSNSTRVTFNVVDAQILLGDSYKKMVDKIEKFMKTTFSDIESYNKALEKVNDCMDDYKDDYVHLLADKSSIRFSYFLESYHDCIKLCETLICKRKISKKENLHNIIDNLCNILESNSLILDEQIECLDDSTIACTQRQIRDSKSVIKKLISTTKSTVGSLYISMAKTIDSISLNNH